eukprot:scaffold534059_cov56-Prasinocladus_malaysianus.AAC.1
MHCWIPQLRRNEWLWKVRSSNAAIGHQSHGFASTLTRLLDAGLVCMLLGAAGLVGPSAAKFFGSA